MTALLVPVLVQAAWHKVENFRQTVGFAQNYDVVPHGWTAPVVRMLALAEAGIALALILPQSRTIAGLFAAALFAGYAGIMASAILRGKRDIDCGCGGHPQVVSSYTLARNGVLSFLALWIVTFPAVTVRPLDAAFAIIAGVVLYSIYSLVEKLASHAVYIRTKGF